MRSQLSCMISALSFLSVILFYSACGQKTYSENNNNKSDSTNLTETNFTNNFSENKIEPIKIHCALKEPDKQPNQNNNQNVQEIKNILSQEIYQQGLSQENAVRFALVNNPDLLAFYDNLEIAYAGLIEAGLVENPVIRTSVRGEIYPKTADTFDDLRLNFRNTINYLDYFLAPLRVRAAEADLNVIESQVRAKVLDLVREVQINWLLVKSLELQIEQQAKIVDIKSIATKLAYKQYHVGDITEGTARRREIEFEEQVEVLKKLEANLEKAAEILSRSLGFGPDICFSIKGEINWHPDALPPDLAAIEAAAIDNRPDIETSRREIIALAEKANLYQPWTYAKLTIGSALIKDPTDALFGESIVHLTVPINNFGQGQALKYNALIDQAQKVLLAKALQACSQVRQFFKTSYIYRSQVLDYELKILPDYRKQVSSIHAHYNVMTRGIYDLLDIKQAELQATIEQILALTNYEQTRIELFHAAGGSFESIRPEL